MSRPDHSAPEVDRPADDGSMIRSEEVLNVTNQVVVSGRVRLRKRVVTETVTQAVEVRREELVVERQPVAEDPSGTAPVGDTAFVDTDYEIVLHEERVVVTKVVVPVERVRLRKQVVADQVTVTEDLDREQIELVTDPATGDRAR